MSQEDRYNPRQRMFSDKKILGGSMDARQSRFSFGFVLYDACRTREVISSRQLSLLRRILTRNQLEQLLQSDWLQQRLVRGVALERGDLKVIIRKAMAGGNNWSLLLGERINLASPQDMLNWVLWPVFNWWENRLDEVSPSTRLALVEQETRIRQLWIKSEFWRQAVEADPDVVKRELSDTAKYQVQALAVKAGLLHKLRTVTQQSRQGWPHWSLGMAGYLAFGALEGFSPVPKALNSFWEALNALDEDPQAADFIRLWLHERCLCRAQDQFYWLSP